jgi:hypothetical protein
MQVNGEPMTQDPTQAVYRAFDMIYYEAGKGPTYGSGTEKDEHEADNQVSYIVVHITKPGTYILNGYISKGQVVVDLGEDAKTNRVGNHQRECLHLVLVTCKKLLNKGQICDGGNEKTKDGLQRMSKSRRGSHTQNQIADDAATNRGSHTENTRAKNIHFFFHGGQRSRKREGNHANDFKNKKDRVHKMLL